MKKVLLAVTGIVLFLAPGLCFGQEGGGGAVPWSIDEWRRDYEDNVLATDRFWFYLDEEAMEQEEGGGALSRTRVGSLSLLSGPSRGLFC